MKFLILTLLIGSCGKPENVSRSHYVSSAEAVADSDGDGMADWDERAIGRDHLKADLNEGLPQEVSEATILEKDMREHVLPVKSSRSLRAALLAKLAGRSVVLPRSNEMIFSFDAYEDFWQKFLAGTSFTHYRLPHHQHGSAFEVGSNFMGKIRLAPPIAEKIMQEVEKKTYRLVISSPEKDIIYRLAVEVSPLQHLAKNHKLQFDPQDNIIGVDKEIQLVENGHEVNYQNDVMLWKTIDLYKKPKAGETVALVYASAKTIKEASLAGIEENETNGQTYKNNWGHETAVTVFMPATKKLHTTIKEHAEPIRIGNGDRENTCLYYERRSHGHRPFVRQSLAEILEMVKVVGLVDPKIDWLATSQMGTAARIRFFAPPGQVSLNFRPELLQQMDVIGVYRSGCEQRVPVRTQQIKTWEALHASFQWIP